MVSFTLTAVAFIIACFVSVLFLIALLLERNDVADVAWGIGILIAAVSGVLIAGGDGPLISLLTAVVLLWSARLSARIFLRNRKKGEDPRYRAWREAWGEWFVLRSYLQIYLLQGALMVVVAYPVIHAGLFGAGDRLSLFAYAGALIWAVGFFFEAVGDYQLDAFIKRPENRGKVMSEGLWRYTRHPNYFGEVTMWWGVWLMVAPLPFGAAALIGPLTITYLILKVSGIPMLEARFAGNPEWEAYKAATNAFFPWKPRRSV